MATTMRDALNVFLVLDNGRIDLAASRIKFDNAARLHMAKQEGEDQLIRECMGLLYNQFKGSFINKNGVVSMTIQRMGDKVPDLKHPSVYGMLSKRVAEVLDEDTEKGIYAVKNGKGGGFCRVVDQSPKA